MATHVRTTIRYDGPALAGHEMDVQDLAPALLALADIVQTANRNFNGSAASMKVLVNADVEQRCFQIDISLVQSILDQAKGFFADDHVKTAEDIAKAIGLVVGGGVGLFKFVKWLSANREAGTRLEVRTEGGITVVINGDGNSINVPTDTYRLASDPVIVDKIKKVVRPLRRAGYETLSFVEGEHIVDTVDKEDARAITDAPNNLAEATNEDIVEIRGPIRIKTPQYEGSAKWTVMSGGRAIDVVMPPEWVQRFQSNEVQAPPGTVLEVVIEQRITVDPKGNPVGAPAFTVTSISGLTLPHPLAPQGDLF
ncbi:MAG: hypothetical protein IM673_08365 [Phenylobacterium sp.]|uniref:hypothetical protein n=1 Tax=Phenylobacterium sp. TaxID=1871053 RepID=UPI0025F55F5D|nr:hypothetical protein [Phenylobacterium sp.]MCA3738054.1 hypothetical protein [Phenylobacterium sp.]MCA3754040.1 hypothetical protein [Phenylobacterium sp.]